MAYVPNATQTTEPVESQTVESAALEFRTLKTSINGRVAALQTEIDAEEVTRAATDAALAATDSSLNLRTTALEQLAFNGSTPGTVVVSKFVATASQTVFNLAVAPLTVATVDVYINGVYQNHDSFTVVANVVTLNEGVIAGAEVEMQASIALQLGITTANFVEYTPAGTGAVATTVQSKLRESVSVLDFGADPTGGTNSTLSIELACEYAASRPASSPVNLVFPAGAYLVDSVVFKDFVYGSSVVMEGAIFYAASTVQQKALVTCVNCVDFHITGSWKLEMQSRQNYESAFWITAVSGTSQSSTRCFISGMVVINGTNAINVSSFDSDFAVAEITFTDCSAFRTPGILIGGGSQSGASFIGCHFTSEYNANTPNAAVYCARLEGGFWYFVGGEFTQVINSNAAYGFEISPCKSTLYGNLMPQVSVSTAHIEVAGVFLIATNPRTLTGITSGNGRFSVNGCGGYISIDTSQLLVDCGVLGMSGYRILFGSANNFYGLTRTQPHIAVGSGVVVDIDGSPFSSDFLQGLSALVPENVGSPVIRNKTILYVSNALNTIASTPTIVNFLQVTPTIYTSYGAQTFNSGVFTAGQDLYDVLVCFQIHYGSDTAQCDTWIDINSSNSGLYAAVKNSRIQSGSMVIPFVSAGSTIAIKSATNSTPAALIGGATTFLSITASTDY